MTPILDRLIEFDDSSRRYPIRALLTDRQQMVEPRSYSWSVPVSLDQGNEGACVGFSWAQEIAARPWPDKNITDDYAIAIYRWAQQNDQWPGEDYDGTSVLAGAKAVNEWLNRIIEYRWAFGIDDVARTIAYRGPVVLGINWYTGMMRPESDGRIRPTGSVEGGHAILLPKRQGARWNIISERRRNFVYNSWGRRNGWPYAYLTDDDLERLLHEQGEACIPVLRKAA